MPFINIKLVEGRTPEQKQELARRITQNVQEILNTGPEHVWVTFDDVPAAEWFIAGKSLGPRR